MADKLKIAIAGAGRAAQELTIPSLGMVRDRAELSALCDPHPEKAELLASRNPGVKAYRELGQMLEKERPDVLIVNTPVESHYSVAMKAIEMGVNVIIEKPAMSSIGELERVRAASEKKGVKASVVHNYKFKRGPARAWEMYQAGELGEILHIDRVWMSPPQNDRMERDPNGWWHKLPGGRLADSLPHHLYISYPYMGEMSVEYVDVRKLAAERPWSKCDEAEIILKANRAYLNIRMSTNQVSWPSKGATYHAILWGTKNNLIVHQEEAALMPCGDADYWLRKGMRRLYEKLKSPLKGRSEITSRGAHNMFFGAFFDYINGKARNPTPWEEAIAVMRLCDEISYRMEEKTRGLAGVHASGNVLERWT